MLELELLDLIFQGREWLCRCCLAVRLCHLSQLMLSFLPQRVLFSNISSARCWGPCDNRARLQRCCNQRCCFSGRRSLGCSVERLTMWLRETLKVPRDCSFAAGALHGGGCGVGQGRALRVRHVIILRCQINMRAGTDTFLGCRKIGIVCFMLCWRDSGFEEAGYRLLMNSNAAVSKGCCTLHASNGCTSWTVILIYGHKNCVSPSKCVL